MERCYMQGFIDKCAELGVNPSKMLSQTPTIEHDVMDSFLAQPGKVRPSKVKPDARITTDLSEAPGGGNSAGTAFSRAGYTGPAGNRPG
jgi:hypothetical protein